MIRIIFHSTSPNNLAILFHLIYFGINQKHISGRNFIGWLVQNPGFMMLLVWYYNFCKVQCKYCYYPLIVVVMMFYKIEIIRNTNSTDVILISGGIWLGKTSLDNGMN